MVSVVPLMNVFAIPVLLEPTVVSWLFALMHARIMVHALMVANVSVILTGVVNVAIYQHAKLYKAAWVSSCFV